MNSETERKTAAVESETTFAEAARKKKEAEQALAAAENKAKETPALEAETRELREKRPVVAQMLAEEEKLVRLDGEAETLRVKTETLNRETERSRKRLAGMEDEIQTLELLSQQAGEIELRLESAKSVMERLRDLKRIAAEADVSVFGEKTAAKAVEKLRTACDELSRRIPVLEDELARLKADKERHERGDMAAHLAVTLKHGEPCPVCGAREHPLPALKPAALFGVIVVPLYNTEYI